MSNGLVRKADEHEDPAIKTIEFILRLASDPQAENDESVRKENVSAILNQLDNMSKHVFFPHLMDIIDPSRHYAQTKLLPQYAKDILIAALDRYCG